MCGIAGVFGYAKNSPPVDVGCLKKMNGAMLSRGPDGQGTWKSDDNKIGLTHRRLSILDLSKSGAQPMQFKKGRLIITYNGEIYNFRELRKNLKANGHQFLSNSDTEVLLHLYDKYKLSMVNMLRGMFAFAIFDQEKKGLFLARDEFGIKPLYYADDGYSFRFASQVKALIAGGDIDTTRSAAGEAGFYVWGYVPDPWTMFKQVHSLPAGNTMWVDLNGAQKPRQYFDVAQEYRKAAEQPKIFDGELLRDALKDTIKHHLISDVPVGTFLSAGLDSATIVGLASEIREQKIRTVTLAFDRFEGTKFDEAQTAEKIATHYGTSHQTIRVKGSDFLNEYEKLCNAMDQPSIDGVNTYFISKITAETGLKVALSGLGGDEFFGGYSSFHEIPQIARITSNFPWLKKTGKGLRRVFYPYLSAITSPKYASVLEYGTTYPDLYLLRRAVFMPWELPSLMDPVSAREGWEELEECSARTTQTEGIGSPRAQISVMEACLYMRSQLLRDTDWAGMAHSLEIRVPLVDKLLFNILAPMIVSKNPPNKQDLTASLKKPLPREVLNRPKTGFAVPMRDWLLQRDPRATQRGFRGWAKQISKDCYK